MHKIEESHQGSIETTLGLRGGGGWRAPDGGVVPKLLWALVLPLKALILRMPHTSSGARSEAASSAFRWDLIFASEETTVPSPTE